MASLGLARLLLLLGLCVRACRAQGGDLRLGLLLPMTEAGASEAAAALLALQHARDGDYRFSLAGEGALGFNATGEVFDTEDVTTSIQSAAVAAALRALDAGVDVLIGPSTSAETIPVTAIANIYQVPEVSYSATTSAFTDTTEYPFFARVVPADSLQGAALAELFDSYGFAHVNCISNAGSYGEGVIRDFTFNAVELGLSIDVSVDPDDEDSLTTALASLEDSPVRAVLLASSEDDLLAAAGVLTANGMMSDEWTWVGADAVVAAYGEPELAKELYAHGIVGSLPDDDSSSPLAQAWADAWHNLTLDQFPELQARNLTLDFAAEPGVYPRFAYDAVWQALWGWERARRAGESAGDGPAYMRHLVNSSFVGVTGAVSLDVNGDRVTGIQIVNVAPGAADPEPQRVGLWTQAAGLVMDADVVWQDGTTTVPSGVIAACGVGYAITYDDSGLPFCVRCPAGTYNVDGDGVCHACPSQGAVCSGGSNIAALEGYWQYELEFYQCVAGMCCPDGACTSNATDACAPHREGVLCGRCEYGYTDVDGTCVECSGVSWDLVVLYVLATSLLVFWAVRQKRKGASSAMVKVCVGFVQLVALVIPDFEDGGMELARLLNLQVTDMGAKRCLFPMGAHTHASSGMFITTLIFGELFLAYVGHLLVHRYRKRTAHRGNFIRGGWRLLFLCYTSIVQTGLLLLNCRTVGPYTVLTSYPDVECWQGLHTAMAVGFGAVFFAGAVVVPVFIVVFLHSTAKKRRLMLAVQELESGGGGNGGDEISLNHATLFAAYRRKYRLWYEAAFVSRRTVFAIVYAFCSLQLLLRQTLFFIFSFVLLVIHLQTKPFLSRSDNNVETYFLVVLCFITGLQLLGLRADNTDEKPAAVQVLIPLVLVGSIAAVVARVIYIKRLADLRVSFGIGRLQNEEDAEELAAAMQEAAVQGGEVKQAVSLRGYRKRTTMAATDSLAPRMQSRDRVTLELGVSTLPSEAL